MRNLLTAILALLLWGSALSHAELLTSQPEANSVIEEAPAQVSLNFSEAVELPFSTYKVYPLGVDAAELPSEPESRDWLRLNGLAAELVAVKLSLRGDEEERVDEGVSVEGDARRVHELAIALSAELAPGAYVVMWRALSEDGHVVQGHFVFLLRGDLD